jgi:tetratricopeptide (TPR) repeat protein
MYSILLIFRSAIFILLCLDAAYAKFEAAAADCEKGVALFEAGNLKDARPVLEEAVWRLHLQPSAPELQRCLNNLGSLYIYEARFPQAEAVLRRAVELGERDTSVTHAETSRSLVYLGKLELMRDEENNLSEKYAESAVNLIEENFGLYHSELVFPLSFVVEYYANREQCGKARIALDRVLKIVGGAGAVNRIEHGKVYSAALIYNFRCSDSRYEAGMRMKAQLIEVQKYLPALYPTMEVVYRLLARVAYDERRVEDAEKYLLLAKLVGQGSMGAAWPRAGKIQWALRDVYMMGFASGLAQQRPEEVELYRQKLRELFAVSQ